MLVMSRYMYIPLPIPEIMRPAISWPALYVLAWTAPPRTIITQPRVIAFFRPNRLPKKAEITHPIKQPMLKRATMVPRYPELGLSMAAKKPGYDTRPPSTPWSYPNNRYALPALTAMALCSDRPCRFSIVAEYQNVIIPLNNELYHWSFISPLNCCVDRDITPEITPLKMRGVWRLMIMKSVWSTPDYCKLKTGVYWSYRGCPFFFWTMCQVNLHDTACLTHVI